MDIENNKYHNIKNNVSISTTVSDNESNNQKENTSNNNSKDIEFSQEYKEITKKDIKIDINNNKYPYCIVWTQLPGISCCLPIIGHTGIADSNGVIFDFAGSRYISEDDLAFGEPYKYVQLEPCEDWDEGIKKANEKFWNEDHNIFTNNCHSHVAYALENMNYENKSYFNMINVWFYCLVKSKYVSWFHLFKNYSGLVVIIGIILLIKLL